jgi:hypothetical protein
MTKDGKWRFVRPGEMVIGGLNPFQGGRGPATVTTTTTTTRPSAFSQSTTVRGGLGLLQGVASTSTDKSLRIFNGRTRYDEWVFAPGQPRIIGKPIGLPTGPMGAPNSSGLRGMVQPSGPQAAGHGQPGAVPGSLGQQSQPYVVPP